MVEGDIAKMAVREYENCQNMIKYLCTENDTLRAQNINLIDDVDRLKRELAWAIREK